MQLQDVLVLVMLRFPNLHSTTINIYKLTHLRIEALGHDVVVVRRLLGHGGGRAFLGLVNEEPICGNDDDH